MHARWEAAIQLEFSVTLLELIIVRLILLLRIEERRELAGRCKDFRRSGGFLSFEFQYITIQLRELVK